MVAVWSRLHNLVKSFICLVVLVSAIVVEHNFINEPKIESVSIILNKDKETVYKGGTSYIMCLQQITDKKIFSLNVGYSTYSLFEKGDTITFKLRPNQVYEETTSRILAKNISPSSPT